MPCLIERHQGFDRVTHELLDVVEHPHVRLEGTFMAFTEEDEFDREQLQRFRRLHSEAAAEGLGWFPEIRNRTPSIPARATRRDRRIQRK